MFSNGWYSHFTVLHRNVLYSVFYKNNIAEDQEEVHLSMLWRVAVYCDIGKPVKGGFALSMKTIPKKVLKELAGVFFQR